MSVLIPAISWGILPPPPATESQIPPRKTPKTHKKTLKNESNLPPGMRFPPEPRI